MLHKSDVPHGPGLGTPVLTSELDVFRNDLVWPAVNCLYGSNFLTDALLGDSIDIKRKFSNPSTLASHVIELSVECKLYSDTTSEGEESEPRRLCSISLLTGQDRNGERQQIIERALRSLSIIKDLTEVDPEDMREYFEECSAWRTNLYYFDSDEEEFAKAHHSICLRDDEGVVWDDFVTQHLADKDKSDGAVDDEHKSVLEELDFEANGFFSGDLAELENAFKLLTAKALS